MTHPALSENFLNDIDQAEIHEKNTDQTIDKQVQEDSNENWGNTDDADIGQTINFSSSSTITGKPKVQYRFVDTMSTGLTYNNDVTVYLNNSEQPIDVSNYEVKTGTNATSVQENATFIVELTENYCKTLKSNDIITLKYSAVLNENAVIAGEGNPNKIELDYREKSNDDWKNGPDDTTITYTWKLDIKKYTKDGNTETPLSGAKFSLSKNQDGSNPIALVGSGTSYKVAKSDAESKVTDFTTTATGEIEISGLDADTYYLTELEAPTGYNKLSAPVKVVIASNDGAASDAKNAPEATSLTHSVKDESDNVITVLGVENKKGSQLPETGGMGTTMLYVAGGALVLGSAVFFITNRKMRKEN